MPKLQNAVQYFISVPHFVVEKIFFAKLLETTNWMVSNPNNPVAVAVSNPVTFGRPRSFNYKIWNTEYICTKIVVESDLEKSGNL